MNASGASRSDILYLAEKDGRSLLRSSDGGQTWVPAEMMVAGVDSKLEPVKISIGGIANHGSTLFGSIEKLKNKQLRQTEAQWEGLPGVCFQRSREHMVALYVRSFRGQSRRSRRPQSKHSVWRGEWRAS